MSKLEQLIHELQRNTAALQQISQLLTRIAPKDDPRYRATGVEVTLTRAQENTKGP